jgi:hypothetical protein
VKIRIYSWSIFLAGVVALWWSVANYPPPDWSTVLYLGVLAFVAEWLALRLPTGGTISVAFSMQFAAMLLGGPATGALVSLMSSIPPQDIADRRPPHRLAFNAGQYVLSVAVAGAVFLFLGGQPLATIGTTGGSGLYSWIVAALLAALVYVVLNTFLVAMAISISGGTPAAQVWLTAFRSFGVSFLALTLLAIVLAQLVVMSGLLSVLLLAVPFFFARKTFRVYQELSEAYRDTLRSLVTLLEAKDPYTRGHSERVAVYAREIAETIGMTHAEAQAVEYAALLHDVGKVGVAAATLTKPGRLSPDEYEEIKLHPVTASRVLGDVELLMETLPLIESHHERLDGSGYPYGLTKELIPRGALVLAVADSFDAMTSTRSYRPAMTHKDALAELTSESGSRLSAECVDALRAAILAGEFAELHETGYDWEVEHA